MALEQVSIPVLQFPSVRIIPRLLRTRSLQYAMEYRYTGIDIAVLAARYNNSKGLNATARFFNNAFYRVKTSS